MKRAALVLVAALALPAGLAAQTTVDQRRPAPPDGAVSIENMAGSIKVTGWDRAEVQVKGTIADGRASSSSTGPERKARTSRSSRRATRWAKSDLDVMVPAGSSVSIEGFQATIIVAGVTGSVKAETVNGSITHAGAVEGRRAAERQRRRRDERRSSGRVNVEAVNGAITRPRRLRRARGVDGERQAAR